MFSLAAATASLAAFSVSAAERSSRSGAQAVTLEEVKITARRTVGFDVFARNLFAKDYVTALTIQTGNSGLILGQPSDPRIMGVTLRARF